MNLTGLHHVTAICESAQDNIDFYSKLLGLRLVKITINFDDPGSYHLYYGDKVGSPGTCMTFFAWPNAPLGAAGSSMVSSIGFSVPVGSFPWWKIRLDAMGQTWEEAHGRLGFSDPDGIQLELIEGEDERTPWIAEGFSGETAIRGFHSVRLSVGRLAHSAELLKKMGFSESDNQFAIGAGNPGQIVELIESQKRGTQGAGTVHHVAFATQNDETQEEASKELESFGQRPTPVQERQYFRSIYYREPSGVLYEIATSGPGFTVDEPVEILGERLCLPSWYESRREAIAANLPPIITPTGAKVPF